MEKMNLTVGGNKRVSVENKVNEKGYFNDSFGNTIFITGSEADLARKAGKPKKARKAKSKKKEG